MRYTVQIVGVGGQGVLLASMVLGTAAMRAGYKVSMSEVHGMAQRGGSVISTLRFGDEAISPLESTGGADLLIGFEPVETCRYIPLCNKDTFILMNLDPVYPSMVAAGFEEYPDVQGLVDSVRSRTGNLMTLDATKVAISAGNAVSANAVMIGATAAVKGFPIEKGLLKEVLLGVVPEKSKDLNSKAFEMGHDIMS